MLNEAIIQQYIPMTETAAYILLSLTTPLHGYGIIENVMKMTDNRIKLGAGTIYGTLVKLEKSNLISLVREEDKRKIYQINEKGLELLRIEEKRTQELNRNIKEVLKQVIEGGKQHADKDKF